MTSAMTFGCLIFLRITPNNWVIIIMTPIHAQMSDRTSKKPS